MEEWYEGTAYQPKMRNKTAEWLEPCDSKGSSTVLKGRGHRKVPELPSRETAIVAAVREMYNDAERWGCASEDFGP